ncbi:MAG TPA: peptidoglycan recognition family protein [Kofleriaceae bacterium]|nr:peptidoglycan recognition family protein [Kofleriaceae bacterium]
MQWRVLGLVVAVGCSQPARPRDEDPVRAAGAPRPSPAPIDGAAPGQPRPEPGMGASARARSQGAEAAVARTDAPSSSDLRDLPNLVDAPMAWSDERARLTLDYRRQHSDPDATDLTIEPHVIVLHYTAGGSATGTRRYFDNVRMEAARKELARAGAVNVSAHFLVDRDGTIYQLQPPTRFARHCIGLNHVAIGIENVGDEAKFPLTDAQIEADAALVRALAARYRITHLLGHHEVMKFRKHPYYVERDAAYKNEKPDPGPRFMAAVRARVADLKLAGLGS